MSKTTNNNEMILKLEALSQREQRVMQERLGLKGKPKSRMEVCKMFDISDDRLREVEEKAKKLLSK